MVTAVIAIAVNRSGRYSRASRSIVDACSTAVEVVVVVIT
jgi:hypothetical protein